MDALLFIIIGAGIAASFYGVGTWIVKGFGFDRSKAWGAVADWAHANEQAARHRAYMRQTRPWRQWYGKETL